MREGRGYNEMFRNHDLIDSHIEAFSQDYEHAEDRNNPTNETGILQATRIIRIDEDTGIVSLTTYEDHFIHMKDELKRTIREMSQKMSQKIDDLTVDEESAILERLKKSGLSTVIYLTLSQGTLSRKPIFNVHFPKLLMDIDPTIPPSDRIDFGVAVAAHFFKRVPI